MWRQLFRERVQSCWAIGFARLFAWESAFHLLMAATATRCDKCGTRGFQLGRFAKRCLV